jgi:hypothetical protein
MRVVIVARLGGNRQSGLELDRAYLVYAGPDPDGRVLVFDDHHTSFRWVTPGEYREVPDPLERHDLVAIQHGPGGWQPVCSCVWRWHRGWPDPDEAARSHLAHQWHMQVNRWLLEGPADPQLLLADLERLRGRGHRNQEPER